MARGHIPDEPMTVDAPQTLTIAAGEFLMGSDDAAGNESPAHLVWVDAFAVSPYAVTTEEYARFLRATGHVAPPLWGSEGFADARQPVVAPSWHDAVAYCAWLSEAAGQRYRLPTEAEREKAARGGGIAKYPWGDDLPAEHRGGRDTALEPVDAYEPNGYGLYGMASGVHEWCADWYADDYYAVSPSRNPTGPASSPRKVARGGSWRHHVRFTRCAARSALAPDKQFTDFGFRVVRTLG
jgi:formylglycine-generating enzyme required for sulfatase activity